MKFFPWFLEYVANWPRFFKLIAGKLMALLQTLNFYKIFQKTWFYPDFIFLFFIEGEQKYLSECQWRIQNSAKHLSKDGGVELYGKGGDFSSSFWNSEEVTKRYHCTRQDIQKIVGNSLPNAPSRTQNRIAKQRRKKVTQAKKE